MRLDLHITRCLLLATGLCIAHFSYALENISLQLNWTHGFQFAGYYAAQELGYYKDAGLNVNIEEAAPNSDPVPEIIAGKSQYGVGTSSILLARAAGKPVVALAAIFQHSPYVIYTAENIENIHSLAGKKIIVESQSDELIAYLKKEGISLDKVQRQANSLDPNELISGKVDAISGTVFNKPYAFDLTHFGYRTYFPRMSGIDFYGDNLFTSELEIEKHPVRASAFLQASLRGWRYALDHPDEIIDLILKKYSTHYSREFLQFESLQTLPLLNADLIDIGYSTPMRWQRIADIYTEAGLLKGHFSLEGFIYEQHPNIQNETGDNYWRPGWIITLLILFCLICLCIIFIFKLKRNTGELNTLNQRELTDTHVLKLLMDNVPLAEVLNAIVQYVHDADKQAFCTILLFNHNDKQIRFGTIPEMLKMSVDNLSAFDLNTSFPVCAPTLQSGNRTIAKSIHSNLPCVRCKYIASKTGMVSCCSEPIISSTGKMIGVFSIFHQIPYEPSHHDTKVINQLARLAGIAVEFIQSKQMLQQQHDLLAKISAQIPGIIFQFRLYPDGRSCFPFISQAVRTMYGLAPEDLRDDATPFFGYRHPEDADRLEESVRESARSLSRWFIEYRLIIPGQGIRWRMGDAMPEKLDDGSIIWHGFITDITERKQSEERVQRLEQYDVLTGLPNRALLSDRLQQALSNAKREQSNFAMMFIDIDNFKQINDTLGHAIGDKLLASSAERMHLCMRESDTLSRIGWDEFVVLLPNAESEHDANIVAEKIRQFIDIPFDLENNTLNVTVSIGVAMYPDHGENEIELSKNADRAMYYAKQHGKNTVMVYHDKI